MEAPARAWHRNAEHSAAELSKGSVSQMGASGLAFELTSPQHFQHRRLQPQVDGPGHPKQRCAWHKDPQLCAASGQKQKIVDKCKRTLVSVGAGRTCQEPFSKRSRSGTSDNQAPTA